MPPRNRKARQEENDVTTTEETTDHQTDDVEPSTDETPDVARRRIRADDAVFYSDFESGPPPAGLSLRSESYVRSAYDDAMDIKWQRYLDMGKPAWSLSNGNTKDDKPEGGWYVDDPDIWFNAIVPDPDIAETLIKRAAKRIGCAHRFRKETLDPADDGTARWKIYFAAAPRLERANLTATMVDDVPTPPDN
jgi:hypothetical protein